MSTEPQPATETPPAAGPSPAASPRLDTGPQPDTPQIDAPPSQPSQQQPGQQQPGQQQPLPPHTIRHTRISGLWTAVAFFAVVLLFLLIFILENGHEVDISFLGAHGHLPLGVALLLAAVCGVLLTILAGAARMAQLHSVARRHRRIDAKRQAPTQSQ